MDSSKRYFANPYPEYSPLSTEYKHDVPESIKNSIVPLAQAALAMTSVRKDLDGGIYVGPAGLTYMLFMLRLRSRNLKWSLPQELLGSEPGTKLLESQLAYYLKNSSRDNSGFILGQAGIHAVAAAFYNISGDTKNSNHHLSKYAELAKTCKPIAFLPCGSDELFVGRSGYLCGALWLEEVLGTSAVPEKDLKDIWNATIESGKQSAAKHRSPCPLMYSYYRTEYLGAAHGLSSILQILLSFPQFCTEFPHHEKVIKETIDFVLSLQTKAGNFPPEMDDVRAGFDPRPSEELVHFCHGAPGVIYMLGKAYLHFKDSKYLDASIQCGKLVWEKGLLCKGPGICHGVAGNGYVFLLLYRLTNDPSYLYKAIKFAEFMNLDEFKTKSRTPDSPFSLYEGLAGTVCFLLDLMEPNQATFPFFNIFYNHISLGSNQTQ